MSPSPERAALVLGATGGIGGDAASALTRHGWRVRALAREPDAAARPGRQQPDRAWVRGDAMDAASVAEALQRRLRSSTRSTRRAIAPPMLENTVWAAQAAGARILLPGTVCNYGPDAHPVLREASPQNPATRKG